MFRELYPTGMSRSMEQTLLWIIRASLYGIVSLPLLVTMQTMFPYIFGKIIFFRIFAEIGIAAWFILCIYKKEYRPSWRHPIIVALTVFVGALVLTMVTGIDIERSFWSTQERMTGVLTFLHLWLFALMVASTQNRWNDWRAILFFTLGVNAIVDWYGFFHLSPAKTIISTLGNPIYVSVYAMLHVFLGLILLPLERKRFIKVLLGLSIALNIVVILNTGSRSALYSAIIATAVSFFAVRFLSISKKARLKLAAGFFVVVVACLGVSILFLKIEQVKQWGKTHLPPTVERALYGGVASNADRLVLWRIGIKGFLERPLLGWGWENYDMIYDKHLVPRPFMEPWYDRSHNQIVDMAALTGVVGIVAYFSFWLMLLLSLTKRIRNEQGPSSRFALAALAAFFVGYFIQNLTIFDSPAPLFIFFLGVALAVFLTGETRRSFTSSEAVPSFAAMPLAILVLFLLPLALYFFNIRPFIHSTFLVRGVGLLGQLPGEAFDLFQKSIKGPSFMKNELLSQAYVLFDSVLERDSGLFSYDKRVGAVDYFLGEFAARRPSTQRAKEYITASQVAFRGYTLTGRADYLKKARQFIDSAKTLSPKRREVYTQLSSLAFFETNGPGAVDYAQKALSLAAEKDLSALYFHLAKAHFLNKDAIAGSEALRAAESRQYPIFDDSGPAVHFANAISRDTPPEVKKYAKEYINNAYRKNKGDIFFQSAHVILYYRLGELVEAKKLMAALREVNKNAADQVEKLLSR